MVKCGEYAVKKSALFILLTTITAGFAFASVEVSDVQVTAMAMPAPSTIFICTAGMAFLRYLTKKKP
jgi:hypothetical protein